MLTKRNIISAAEAATGRSIGYQGQPSTRQMCLPLSASADDGRRIRQITKQNSFHDDNAQTNGHSSIVPQLKGNIDRTSNRNAPLTTPYHHQSHHDQTKMATRLPPGGPPPMSTSWTSGGNGSSDDVQGPWRQFRGSDRSLRYPGQQRLGSAKYASSLELSLGNDNKGSESHAFLASPGPGRGGGGGRVGVEGGSKSGEVGPYFQQSSSPRTQAELTRIFEGPTPSHVRSGEGVSQDGPQRTRVLNGALVFPPGLLESSTAGSYPELHNIALHESRRGSLPAPRRLDEAIARVRKENPYENSSLTSNRRRNQSSLYRSNGDGNNLQNGNGKTSTTFHDGNIFNGSTDGNIFKSSTDGNGVMGHYDGKRFWSAQNGTTASRQDGRYADGTPRENIYEEIDSLSLMSSTNGNSVKQPPTLQTTTTMMTTTTNAVQSGGYRGPIMSLRLTPDQLTLSNNSPLSKRHRLFSSTRFIQQSLDDVLSQEYPNPQNRTQRSPVLPTGPAHPNPELRVHPRPYSRNPEDHVGSPRGPDRVARVGGQGTLGVTSPIGVSLPLGVTSDGYLEPVTLTQPLDVTVTRLEALLQEKDGERKRLQAAMEDKECCLIKQLRLEKWNSEVRLVELSDEWNRRLACHQQKAFRIEQSLLSQIYKLRTEKKSIKEQLDRLRLENEVLDSRVGHLETDLQTSAANETRLQSLNDEKEKELESLRVRLMDATAALLSSATTNKYLNSESTPQPFPTTPATAQSDEYRRIQSANHEAEEKEEEEEEETKLRLSLTTNNKKIKEDEGEDSKEKEDSNTSAPLATYRPNIVSGSDDDDVIRRLERELEETRSRLVEAEERMRADQEQWLDEKKKVIAYQKQLQLNYIQIVQRNRTLQQETHQLALELERQHIRQVDAESLASPATLANTEEIACAELTQAARTTTLTRSTLGSF